MTTITNKLTDERVSNAMLIRLIQWADQHNSHYVAAALCELQERRKADSTEPAQVVSIPDDWQTCEKLSNDSYVDNALRELVEDTTGDNGVRVVQAVIRALRDSGLIRAYPDLSQPVDPQISEYEKIMLQDGMRQPVASGQSASQSLTDALCDVIAERQRQIRVKGWTPEHDDTYIGCELAAAAISYIEPVEAENYWPADWHDGSFRPSDYRRNLVKATALLVAELERLDRISDTSVLSEVSDGDAGDRQ